MIEYDKLLACRRHLASRPQLWHFDLLTPLALWRFARARGVSIFSPNTVEQLWQVGLLRADVVTATREIRSPRLESLQNEPSATIYLDGRRLRRRAHGYGGAFPKRTLRRDIQLFFHPFRYYVLYHVARVFSLDISTTQYLSYPPGYAGLANRLTGFLDQWTSDHEFCDVFQKWNSNCEIAIACEPVSHPVMSRASQWHFPADQPASDALREAYKALLGELITEPAVRQLEQHRETLCLDGERLDDNTIVHVLLRLTTWHLRGAIRGHVGGSMLLLSMAETIRRSMEELLGRQLPEEDECGQDWIDGARRMLYGTDRALDAPQTVLRTFLADAGLDYGTKVRCYLEGETELGAMKVALEQIGTGGIELVNLSGQFVESKRKGLGFRESLKNDSESGIFSFIAMDADSGEYIRVVRQAAREDLVCGMFFVSDPDFEMGNFTHTELCEIVLGLAQEASVDVPDEPQLMRIVGGATSGKDFFRNLTRYHPNLARFAKGEPWGEALMRYAIAHPHWRSGEKRSVVEMAELVGRASGMKYVVSRERFRLDPNSGKLVERTLRAPISP